MAMQRVRVWRALTIIILISSQVFLNRVNIRDHEFNAMPPNSLKTSDRQPKNLGHMLLCKPCIAFDCLEGVMKVHEVDKIHIHFIHRLLNVGSIAANQTALHRPNQISLRLNHALPNKLTKLSRIRFETERECLTNETVF